MKSGVSTSMAPTGRGTDRGSGSLSGLCPCDHPDSQKERPGDLPHLSRVAPRCRQFIADFVHRFSPGLRAVAERRRPSSQKPHELVQIPLMGHPKRRRVDLVKGERDRSITLNSQPCLREPEMTKNLGLKALNDGIDFRGDAWHFVAPSGEDAIR